MILVSLLLSLVPRLQGHLTQYDCHSCLLRGMYRFPSASARLAVSDAIRACAVDSSDELVDGVPLVSITPGIDWSLLLRMLASSFTLSTTMLRVCYS